MVFRVFCVLLVASWCFVVVVIEVLSLEVAMDEL